MLAGSEKHVVLCATNLRPTTLIDFLNEFYADVKLQVCFLCYFSRGEIVIFKNVDNIDLFNYMKEDDRSYIHNFCSCEKNTTAKVASITAMIFLYIVLHSAVHMYDFHIFITLSSSSFHGFITNQFNDLLPVGLLA